MHVKVCAFVLHTKKLVHKLSIFIFFGKVIPLNKNIERWRLECDKRFLKLLIGILNIMIAVSDSKPCIQLKMLRVSVCLTLNALGYFYFGKNILLATIV